MAATAKTAGGLLTRVVVGTALAVVAIAAVWAGGIAFTALVMAAVLLMSAEWSVMHGITRGFRLASLIVLAFAGGIAVYVSAVDALIVLAASAGMLGLFMRGYDRNRAFWVAAGLLYCGLPMIALLWLRVLPETTGLFAVTLLFAIVWATDIAAFFTGRAVGGPRLAPAISPNKTWAGALGGLAAAACVTATVGHLLPPLVIPFARPTFDGVLWGALSGAGLACVAIAGDLFESWLKRRAGVKDSGNLLPGHGGVMDRIDGLVPVAVVGAIIYYAQGFGR